MGLQRKQPILHMLSAMQKPKQTKTNNKDLLHTRQTHYNNKNKKNIILGETKTERKGGKQKWKKQNQQKNTEAEQ